MKETYNYIKEKKKSIGKSIEKYLFTKYYFTTEQIRLNK